MPRYDVLVVGGVGVDTTVRLEAVPPPLVDCLHVPPIRDYVGHTGNGVSLGCQALGLATKFIDFIGDDPQGQLVLARYREAGLDFSHLVHASGTRRSVNMVDRQGRRLSLYDGRHPADLRMPRDFYLPFLQDCRHVHLSIINWARELLPEARALGIPVSTDLHDWDGVNPYHHDFAYQSDLVFFSTAAIPDAFERPMRDILQTGRAEVVVAMAGDRGSYVLQRGSSELRHFPIVELGRPIVDTNGAGDSFVSAFLYGRSRGYSVADCMRLGSMGGAYACGCAGTHEEFIRVTELERYLKD